MHTESAVTDAPMLKSLLFVPGDSERKMAKAQSSAANAIILDLEDAVAVDRIGIARGMVNEYLASRPDRSRQQLWVRINPLTSALSLPDLVGIVAGAPNGILLPKIESAQDIVRLDHYLTVLEMREGVAAGAIRIIPVASETPQAMFALGTYRGASARLAGLTWGAEDLSTALGASTNRLESGEYEFTYQLARSLCLVGANAAGVQAIDTITPDFRDRARLEREVRASRRAGFTGKMAIHPDQVDVINTGYAPDEEELREAKAIVEAFTNAGGAGAVQIEGRMLDKPHLTQALRVIRMAQAGTT
ncbi:MAG TPA: CoA ester lyase [Casimicrobiaceae bacterium]|nr:CoA ester lyase [Casimicrobiaceae bacterium]